jgi:predicted nucleotidyltransferase
MNLETQNFVEELKKRQDVIGVILFGSWARGNNRPDSDVDLVVILNEGYRRTVEYRNKQAFEIIYTTEKGAFDFWESHKDDALDFGKSQKFCLIKTEQSSVLKTK